MLLYIESSVFVVHTFLVRCSPSDSLARVRARLMHLLYDMGRENHQFRLRFQGQFLRDSYSLDDYRIGDRCILKMVPMAKRPESVVASDEGHDLDASGTGHSEEITRALLKEVTTLKWREAVMRDFKGSLFVSWLFVLFSFLTAYWYAGIWNFVITIYAITRCPTYTHRGGFVGTSSLWPRRFMTILGALLLLDCGATVALAVLSSLSVFQPDCIDVPGTTCSPTVNDIYSMTFFVVHTIYLFGVSTTVLSLLKNFGFSVGGYLEGLLIISRDVEKVIQSAKSGKIKEQRTAAFELATLATTGDDSKFRIVAEGGLEVLISLGLSSDEATQEYATEAIAELLTIPAIQDQFVEAGGVATLCTILRSTSQRLIQEAATALSYIVADSEENRQLVAADRGLEDLSYAAKTGSEVARRCIAGIFLDLAFSSEIRTQMTAMNSPTSALVTLCGSSDTETIRLSLQTLELIAIESPDVILYHEELLSHLLAITKVTLDTSLYLLAGKLLLYFAENSESCSHLLDRENLKETLMGFVKTRDATIQKVACKLIHCMLEEKGHMLRARELGLKEALSYVCKHAGDRDAWNMADEGVTIMDGYTLPRVKRPTSAASMGSSASLRKKDYFARSSTSLDKAGPSGSTDRARSTTSLKNVGSHGSLGSSASLRKEDYSPGSSTSLDKAGPSGSTGQARSILSLQKLGSQGSLGRGGLKEGSLVTMDEAGVNRSGVREGSPDLLQQAKMGSQASVSSRGN